MLLLEVSMAQDTIRLAFSKLSPQDQALFAPSFDNLPMIEKWITFTA
jgi:hypothetical protein